MIRIDTQSREPLVEQLMKSLKRAIASGFLAPGQELPSARQLGGDLGVHWNTVARAYRQLSEEGLLFVAQGRKTCVRQISGARSPPSEEELTSLRASVREVVVRARLYGMNFEQISELINDEITSWKREEGVE